MPENRSVDVNQPVHEHILIEENYFHWPRFFDLWIHVLVPSEGQEHVSIAEKGQEHGIIADLIIN